MICSIERKNNTIVDVKDGAGNTLPIFSDLQKVLRNTDELVMWLLRTQTTTFNNWLNGEPLVLLSDIDGHYFKNKDGNVMYVHKRVLGRPSEANTLNSNTLKERLSIIHQTIELYNKYKNENVSLTFLEDHITNPEERLIQLKAIREARLAQLELIQFENKNDKAPSGARRISQGDDNRGRITDFVKSAKRFDALRQKLKERFPANADAIDKMSSEELYLEMQFEGKSETDKILIDGKLVTKEEALKQGKELREKSINKGNATDIAMQAIFERDAIKRANLLAELAATNYAWIKELESTYRMRWQIESTSIVQTQASFYSDIFNTSFKPDILIYHEDGTVTIREMKTQIKFTDMRYLDVLKYGETPYLQIMDTKENKAKLQLMLMAFIMKVHSPELKFKKLGVDLVLSNLASSSSSIATDFSVSAEEALSFLDMLQKYINEPQNQAIKDYIISKGIYAKVFNYRDYVTSSPYAERIEKDNKINYIINSNDTYEEKLSKLTQLVTENEARAYKKSLVNLGDSPDDNAYRKKLKEKIALMKSLTNDMYNLYNVNPNQTLDSVSKDMNGLSKYASSLVDSSHPIIASFNKLWQERMHRFSKKKYEQESRFRALYIMVLNEARERAGLSKIPEDVIKNMDGFSLKQHLSTLKHEDIMSRLSVKVEEGGLIYTYLRRPEKELESNYWEGVNIKETPNPLTENEKNLLKFINDYNDSIFIDKVEEGKVTQLALANRVRAQIDLRDGNSMNVTELDYFNNKLFVENVDNRTWNYNSATMNGKFGFIPKTSLTSEEAVQYKHLFNSGAGQLLKGFNNWVLRNFTFFLEDQVKSQGEDELPGLHLRFLGGDNIDTYEGRWSQSIEKSMIDFMDNNLRVEMLQDVYSMGRGVIEYLKTENVDSKTDKPVKSNVLDSLEKLLIYNIKGVNAYDALTMSEDISFLGRILKTTLPDGNGNYHTYAISARKVLKYIKYKTSMAIMGFSVTSAIVNWVQTLQASLRVGLSNSVLRRQLIASGINPDELDFTISDYYKGYKAYLASSVSLADGVRDKLFLMAKELRFLPDSYDWNTSEKSYMTKHLASKKDSVAFVMHSAPEEANAMAMMYAILRNRKHNGKSMWDNYEVEEQVVGNSKIKTLVWKGGIRGKEEVYPGFSRVIEGITAKEAEAYRSIYRNIQGGYRHDERTYFELTVFGDLFLQFRRWVPSMLKKMFATQKTDYSQGFYEWKMKDGESIGEWKFRNMEGRFVTLFRLLFSSVLRPLANIPIIKSSQFGNYLKEYSESLNWRDMTAQQKLNVVESAVTLMAWAMMWLIRAKATDDDDKEENALKKFWMKMEKNMLAPIDPRFALDLINNSTPASWSMTYKRVTGYATLFSSMFVYYALGDEKEALTKDKHFEGLRTSLQATPEFGIAPLYKLYRFGETYDKSAEEYWQDLTQF